MSRASLLRFTRPLLVSLSLALAACVPTTGQDSNLTGNPSNACNNQDEHHDNGNHKSDCSNTATSTATATSTSTSTSTNTSTYNFPDLPGRTCTVDLTAGEPLAI